MLWHNAKGTDHALRSGDYWVVGDEGVDQITSPTSDYPSVHVANSLGSVSYIELIQEPFVAHLEKVFGISKLSCLLRRGPSFAIRKLLDR